MFQLLETEITQSERTVITSIKPESKSLRQMADPEALRLIPEEMMRRYNAIPMRISGETLEVAMADTNDIFAIQALSACCRMRVDPIAANITEVRNATVPTRQEIWQELQSNQSYNDTGINKPRISSYYCN